MPAAMGKSLRQNTEKARQGPGVWAMPQQLGALVLGLFRWEEEKSKDRVRWRQLEHRGPYFVPAYEPLPDGVRIVYDGEDQWADTLFCVPPLPAGSPNLLLTVGCLWLCACSLSLSVVSVSERCTGFSGVWHKVHCPVWVSEVPD